MAFVKGVSGNPSGRPKIDPAFEAAVKKAAKGCEKIIEDLAKNCSDPAVKLRAATWLLERAHGKTPDVIESTGPLVAIIKEG